MSDTMRDRIREAISAHDEVYTWCDVESAADAVLTFLSQPTAGDVEWVAEAMAGGMWDMLSPMTQHYFRDTALRAIRAYLGGEA